MIHIITTCDYVDLDLKKIHLIQLVFKDTDDAEFIEEIMNVLGDEVREVDSFLIVYKYKDRGSVQQSCLSS